MQKLVVGTGARRTLVGAGLSFSPRYETSGGHHRSVWWLNLDLLGFEWRTGASSRLAMSVSIGITMVLDEPLSFGEDCSGGSCREGHWSRIWPQFRFILGVWR
jgi:hypothetical protein